MADELVKADLLKQVAHIEEHYSLQDFNPLKAGGVADYFTAATSAVEVAAAVKAAIDMGVPYQVIGSGSRVLFSDGGFPGLIIHNKTESYGIAMDKSQVVVDAGMPLTRFITIAAGLGLGGLTQFYGEEGTVGGALYDGLSRGTYSILSNLRYLTAVVPPARLDREATINRFKREWMDKEPGLTRMRSMKDEAPDAPQPVILTAMFQLTSVRPDELRQRLQERSRDPILNKPSGAVFGPVFSEMPGVPVAEMLREVKVSQLKVGTVTPDGKFPLYLRSRGQARSSDIRELIEKMQEAVERRYAVTLRPRCEYLGVW